VDATEQAQRFQFAPTTPAPLLRPMPSRRRAGIETSSGDCGRSGSIRATSCGLDRNGDRDCSRYTKQEAAKRDGAEMAGNMGKTLRQAVLAAEMD
jgi:hypothetical protein